MRTGGDDIRYVIPVIAFFADYSVRSNALILLWLGDSLSRRDQ